MIPRENGNGMYLYHFHSSLIIFLVLMNAWSKGHYGGLTSNTGSPSPATGIFLQKKGMGVSIGIQESIRSNFPLLVSVTYISKFSDNGQLVSSYQRCLFLTTVLQLPIITTTLDPKAMLVSGLRYSKFLYDKKGMY